MCPRMNELPAISIRYAATCSGPPIVHVCGELTDHILSRVEYLENDRGDTHEQAVTTALLGMGDPDDLGEKLRYARFPISYLFCLLLTFLVWAAIAGCLAYLLSYFLF